MKVHHLLYMSTENFQSCSGIHQGWRAGETVHNHHVGPWSAMLMTDACHDILHDKAGNKFAQHIQWPRKSVIHPLLLVSFQEAGANDKLASHRQ